MPLVPRLDYPGARHHVMNRGARQARIFFDERCFDRFLEFLGEFPLRYGVLIHGYCLMPNHFHLLLESRTGRLSAAVGHLQRSYSRWLNHRYEWDGPLFRGRFRNRIVDDDDYWRDLLAYIHLNPVRAGLAKQPEAADWTSHGAYTGLSPCPAWLTVEELRGLYGGLEPYLDHLRDLQLGRDAAVDGFDPEGIWRGPLTGIVRLRLSAPDVDRVVVPAWGGQDEEERIEAALVELGHVLGLARSELLASRPGRAGNPARRVVAWWLTWAGRVRAVRVARLLQVRKSGVSQMIAQAQQRRDDDPLLDRWMTALEELYKRP